MSAALWGDASNLGLTPAEDRAEREKLASVSILLQRLDDRAGVSRCEQAEW